MYLHIYIKPIISIWLVLLFASCSDNETTTNKSDLKSNVFRFEPNVIIDSGFGQPMPAITLFTPVGWIASGGVEWGDQYVCTKGFAFNWKVNTSDELTGVALLPQQGWEYNSSGTSDVVTLGCQIKQIYDVQSYLRLILQNSRPDATEIQFRPRPDLVNEIPNNQWSKPWQLGMQHFWTEGGELSFNVVEKGVRLKARLATTVEFMKTVTNTSVTQNESVTVYAAPTLATFAPLGQYDEALFSAMRRSAKPNPNWENAIREHINITNGINLDGAIARHQIKMNTYRDINDMINQTWQNQQISSDKRSEDFIDLIWEQQDYDDASSPTGQTKLSSNYNHAWQLDDGTYLMTDNPSFNPVEELGIAGRQLKKSN